jgi:hypothetical protein
MKDHEKEIIVDGEEPKKEESKKNFKERLAEEDGLPFYIGGIAVGTVIGGLFVHHRIMNRRLPFVDFNSGRDYNVRVKNILKACKDCYKEGLELWCLDKRRSELIKKSDDPNWEIILKLTKNED